MKKIGWFLYTNEIVVYNNDHQLYKDNEGLRLIRHAINKIGTIINK